MLKCTINGQQIEVPQGSTIIQAFMSLQENIAHYCWHPGLSVAGVCRMCMVKIEGNPKLQIACNTKVTEGMVISNLDSKVKEAVEWVLGFHLINHPLDCPICDQAGECGLQEYYMQYGKYDPGMAEKKVKKRKVIDLGPTVVLDSERCILCDRCVRFTSEVTKTNELGIFNRGDHAEVGTFQDKPLINNYSYNVVDICPVGALTSKDFRFKQRVWYLKDFDTICNGCSTGCNIKAYYNENGFYRVKPVHNEAVNGYWMCDSGRDIYKFVNLEKRQLFAVKNMDGKSEELLPTEAASQIARLIEKNASQVAAVMTGQYSSEEYRIFFENFKKLGVKEYYHWVNNPEHFDDFDGLLLRGDRNPNTKGLLDEAKKANISLLKLKDLDTKKFKSIVVAGPEIQMFYPDFNKVAENLSKCGNLVWLTTCRNSALYSAQWILPVKSFVEKSGTFVNYKGISQQFKKGTTIVGQALTLDEFAILMKGEKIEEKTEFARPLGGLA